MLPRRVGTPGATVLLVGFVIGISIFILPGTLAGTAGPAVIVSYLLASLMAVFSCIVAAQIGAAFPVSGASFVAVSRLLSPLWGFVVVWVIIGAGAVAVALLAYGFADYAGSLWPAFDRRPGAMLLVAVLGVLNLAGIRETVAAQWLLVALFMIALAAFCVFGLANLEPSNLLPFMPEGLSPVIAATVPAFFSYTGFMVIIEIGGEIRDPQRNIPRALAASFVIVTVTYLLVTLALVGLVPWRELGGMTAPVSSAASRAMPGPLATGITVTALAAAASSVNILLLGYSRDLFALARSRVLPAFFAKVSGERRQPARCVLLFIGAALLAMTAGGRVTDFATLTVAGLMVLQIAIAVAALRLPGAHGTRYGELRFRLSAPLLRFFAGGLILVSLVFLVIVSLNTPALAVAAAAYLAAGVLYYAARLRQLRRRGIDLARSFADEAARP